MALVLVSLVSLSALWAFAASLTLGDGLNLRKVDTVQDHFGYPSGALASALQGERRLSAVFLGSGTAGDQAAMESGRLVTDRQADLFRRLAADQGAQDAASPQAKRLASRIVQQLDGLSATRAAVERKRMTRAQSFSNYTTLITDLGTLQGSLSTLSNADVARDARNQVALVRAREMLAQEDALLAGALAAGRVTPLERAEFSRMVGAQRTLYNLAGPELTDADRAYLARITGTPEYTRLRQMEDRFAGQSDYKPETGADVVWKTTADSNLTRLRGLELALAEAAERRAEPISDRIMLRLVVAGALGLVAVIVSIVLAIWVARSVIRDLSGLRREALDLADVRLPRVIRRLRRGEEVDVAAEAPPLAFATAEIDQVGQAFNAARRTAIQGAVEEAALRRSINDVFVNLARRSQALLHRQLGLLDSMERRITEPEDLEDLFRVDHLAARMRRHAEGLIILSGQAPGRAWRNPVAVMDVARAAASEVEDYTRVNVAPMSRAAVAGIAVADIVHLLAELIENAAIFSPPHTTVQVSGQQAARGFIIEIDDRGLGMTPEALAAANERLASPGEFDLSDTAQLGLFVVGRLARRHNVKVSLRASPYGGTTAIVLLPLDIVAPGEEHELDSGPAALTRRAEDARIPVGALHDFRQETGPLPGIGPGPGAEIGTGPLPEIDTGTGGSILRLPLGEEPEPPQPGQPGQPFLLPQAPPPSGPPVTSVPPPVFDELASVPVVPPESVMPPPSAPGERPELPARRKAPGDSAGARPALPQRVRQANLAPQLRRDTTSTGELVLPAPVEPRTERSPEELRSMMSSIQAGTRRGRAEPVEGGGES
ncbi:sensor histidine kinase [Actinomadura rudentiformis]|uniref:sensor histidine kinase n=1 Tax=Actinomadura rudentiformis TaxID=359158 RepID=UPI00178C266A|nr:nitrate- and nitrite sensing domain-containing protein [Actinomadura rudentiformis]